MVTEVQILFWVFTAVATLLAGISFYNFASAPRLRSSGKTLPRNPLISVLIPARNEEINIKKCIYSVANQNYQHFEVLVYDDESEDATAEIVRNLSDKIPVKLLSGGAKPEGWLGKNYACSRLAESAEGEILLFIDADVELAPGALTAAIDKLQLFELDFLSAFPTQRMHGFGERLVVPLMNWLLLTFLPLNMVYLSKNRSFSAANGQFLMIRREVYKVVGGHEAFRSAVVEDMEFVRAVKENGYRAMTLLGDDSVNCTMYGSYDEAVEGFTKNFFPGFKTGKISFFLFILVMFLVNLAPFFLIFAWPPFSIPLFLLLLGRAAVASVSRQEVWVNVLLHPVQMVIMFYVGLRSAGLLPGKKVTWKGREIST